MLSEKERAEKKEKKPYSLPELIVYGNIENLTQYPGGANTDGYDGSTLG